MAIHENSASESDTKQGTLARHYLCQITITGRKKYTHIPHTVEQSYKRLRSFKGYEC